MPMLTIHNHHAPSCGDPPIANDSPDSYVGYFENRFGEQWVFTFDRSTKTASLHGGDIGWNTRVEVCDGSAAGLVLQPDEAAWLRACWNAAVK
ncbi:MAG: hypothetical protein RIC55_02315 [Pirellulaceae bacterium]